MKILVPSVIAISISLFAYHQTSFAAKIDESRQAVDSISTEILSHRLLKVDQGATDESSRPYAVHNNFPQLIEQNFAALSPTKSARLLDSLSDKELTYLAQLYTNAASDNGRPAKLLNLLAMRLDEKRLSRVSRFFGFAPVYEAINASVPGKSYAFLQTSKTTYAAPVIGGSVARALSATSGNPHTDVDPTVFLDYTINEIYLSFRTAPIGALSVEASIYSTTMVVAGGTTTAFWGGYAIGTGISNLIDTFAPDLNNAIGSAISSMIDAFRSTLPASVNRAIEERSDADRFDVDPGSQESYAETGGDYGEVPEWPQFGAPGPCARPGATGGNNVSRLPAKGSTNFYPAC